MIYFSVFFFPLSKVPTIHTHSKLKTYYRFFFRKCESDIYLSPSTNIVQNFENLLQKYKMKIIIIMSLYFAPQLDILFPFSLYTNYESSIFRVGAITSFCSCGLAVAECLKCNDLSISSPNYSNPSTTNNLRNSALCRFQKISPWHIQVYSRWILIAKWYIFCHNQKKEIKPMPYMHAYMII